MEEAKIFAVTGFGGGLSVGVKADTAAELQVLVSQMRQLAASDPVIAQLFAPVIGAAQQQAPVAPAPAYGAPDEAQALLTIQQAFPQAQVVSTVGQPLPQPTFAPAAPAAPAAAQLAPPGVAYPGDCPHGPRQYVDKQAKGKPWRRWECATPWKPGMTKAEREARCEAINVEAA